MKNKIIKASVSYNEKMHKLRVFGSNAIISEEEYIAFNKNPDFIAGAEWAEKTVIDKACEWLTDFLSDYKYNGYYLSSKDFDYMITEFKKAMEGGEV